MRGHQDREHGKQGGAEQDLENEDAAAREGVLEALTKDDAQVHGALDYDHVGERHGQKIKDSGRSTFSANTGSSRSSTPLRVSIVIRTVIGRILAAAPA